MPGRNPTNQRRPGALVQLVTRLRPQWRKGLGQFNWSLRRRESRRSESLARARIHQLGLFRLLHREQPINDVRSVAMEGMPWAAPWLGIRHRQSLHCALPIATDAQLWHRRPARAGVHRGFVGWRALPGSMAPSETRLL